MRARKDRVITHPMKVWFNRLALRTHSGSAIRTVPCCGSTLDCVEPWKVALHNTPNDLWVSFLGKVYDLTVLVETNKGMDIYNRDLRVVGQWIYENIHVRKWINCTNTSSSRPRYFSLVQQPDRRYKDTCRCRKGLSSSVESWTFNSVFRE